MGTVTLGYFNCPASRRPHYSRGRRPVDLVYTTDRGYLLSGVFLGAICIYGVVFTNVRLSTNSAFVVLFGSYWFGLVAHYWVHNPHSTLLYIILSTPVAVLATVVILPRFIGGRRQTFTMGLTLVSTIVALIGVWVL